MLQIQVDPQSQKTRNHKNVLHKVTLHDHVKIPETTLSRNMSRVTLLFRGILPDT
jgi:hypothetical protein